MHLCVAQATRVFTASDSHINLHGEYSAQLLIGNKSKPQMKPAARAWMTLEVTHIFMAPATSFKNSSAKVKQGCIHHSHNSKVAKQNKCKK